MSTGNPIFPPANFDLWPMTRTGAIVVDLLVLIIALFFWFLPRRLYSIDGYSCEGQEVVSQYKLWGFWVCGLDSIKVVDGIVTINKRRGHCCCSIQDVTFPVSSVVSLRLKRKSWCSLGILWAILIGCLCGIWLHFIPCIWWICDWGYYDGQGVRGGIWFVTWGIMSLILLVLYPVIELELTVQGDTQETRYYLAVGAGSARRITNLSACYDLETIKRLTEGR